MDIYLDLTLLMNLLIYCFIFLYMNKLGNIKFSLTRKIIIISLLLVKFYFIPLIPDNLTLFFYVYDLIIYLLTFKLQKVKKFCVPIFENKNVEVATLHIKRRRRPSGEELTYIFEENVE